jgi:hypothetical protein
LYDYLRDVIPVDDAPIVVTLDGIKMSESDWHALNAAPDIDHVSQHATTANRDRRLMSGHPTTRTVYVAPCIAPLSLMAQWHAVGFLGTGTLPPMATVWHRTRMDKTGRAVTTECPAPCPKACKADHRHVRHVHREEGRTHVIALQPYGADGLERASVTLRKASERKGWNGRTVKVAASVRVASKAQGRRARRASVGYWSDAAYRADPSSPTVGAYVRPVASWSESVVHRTFTHSRGAVGAPESAIVGERSWALIAVGHEVLPLPTDHPAATFTAARVKVDKPGAQPVALTADAARETLRRRLAADPASMALVAHLLAQCEHAWTTNGQAVDAGHGYSIVVLPSHGGPTLTITHPRGTVASTYKARRNASRQAVALLHA